MIYITYFYIFFYTIICVYNTNLLLYEIDCNLNQAENKTNHDSNIYLEYNFSNDPELFIPTILVPNL
jgi:hypothetical protein